MVSNAPKMRAHVHVQEGKDAGRYVFSLYHLQNLKALNIRSFPIPIVLGSLCFAAVENGD